MSGHRANGSAHALLRSRVVRITGSIAACALLVAAMAVVARNDEARQALGRAFSSPAAHAWPRLIGSAVGSVVLTGLMFSVLMRPFGRVGRLEMQALIATSALLNILPLRPGLLGRAGWHRLVNAIEWRSILRVGLESVAISGVVSLLMLGSALLAAPLRLPPALVVSLPLGITLLAALADRRLRRLGIAAAFRAADVILMAVRYGAAFALAGEPIGISAQGALAAAGTIAGLVPTAGGGLGVREWVIGLLAPALADVATPTAIAADLVNRAGELLVIAVLGIAGALWLWRCARRRTAP